jgi:hypothetical protein
MRLIIKPLGLVVLLASLGALSYLALSANRSPAPAGGTTASAATSEGTVSGIPIIPAGSSQWGLSKLPSGEGTLTIVPVANGPGFKQAIRLDVTKADSERIWAVQACRVVPFILPEGRRMALRFWGRSATGGKVNAVLEKAGEPFDKEATLTEKMTPEWKQYVAPFRASRLYDAGGSQIGLQVGGEKGTYEFAQLELIDYDAKKAK